MILLCLAIGWLAMVIYNIKKGHRFAELLRLSLNGIFEARNVLLTLLLIGMLVGLWRASGTIAYIVTVSIRLVQPGILLLCIFLLNCMVSFLTGTSFGTAATMGVVCMVVANASGVNPVFSGGAVLSGIFFGDRCSFISSSAMLVADITGTDLYDNIRNMLRSVRVPFVLSCFIYALLGLFVTGSGGDTASLPDFSREFVLAPVTLVPAALILLLSAFRVRVRVSILLSCAGAALICLLVQGQSPAELIHTAVFGYSARQAALSALIDGGGISGMVRGACIVCLSSTFAGIIKGTDMSSALVRLSTRLNRHFSRCGCMVLVSLLSSMVGCNQTLAIMLTNQFCAPLYPGENAKLANDLEDTVVVLSPLVPWCIAGAIPVATIGAPVSCLTAACFLYLVPLCLLLREKEKTMTVQ